MPNLFQRLSVKVMLTILAFLLLLGLAMAGLTLLGFRHTQKDAAERSRQALEAQGSAWLLHLAQREANLLDSELEQSVTVEEPSAAASNGDTVRRLGGAEASSGYLADRLEGLSPVPGGHAFLVRNDGHLIAATEAALADLLAPSSMQESPARTESEGLSLLESPNGEFLDTLRAMTVGQQGVNRIELSGRPALLAYAPVPSLDWSLGVVAPVEEVIAAADRVVAEIERDANATIRRVLLVMGLFLCAALVGSAFLSHQSLIRPIDALLAGTRAVAAGDLDVRIPVVFRDELGQLAESFNGMADKLARSDRRRRETLVARERMEEQLRESEEKWRSLTENSTDYIMTVDLESRIQFINKTLPGLPKEQVIGTSFHRYAEPEYEPVSRRCFTDVANSAQPGRFESAYREADGSLRFFESRVAPVMRSGQVVALTVSASDITERKWAEEALRESEERFRQAFEHAAFGMALMGTDGRFLQVNQSVCRMFGFTEDELKKKTFQELTYPDDLQIGVELFEDLVSGRRDYGWLEKRYVRKDGRFIWTLLSTAVVRDVRGATLYLVSQIQDITDRKQAEADVVERKEQYQGIFEATSDGFVITDLEGTIIEVNPAFLKMHGSSRQELLGRHSSVFVHPDDQGKFGEFLEAVQSGESFQGRWMDVRRDGATFHAEVRGTPFAYRSERHALGVVRDISEEVQAQQVLEERVAARTRELAVLYDVTAVASASLDLSTVMDESLDRVLEVMGCEMGGIHLRADEKSELRIAASRNTPEELLTEVETMAPGIGVVGHVLTEGVPIVVPVVADDPRVVPLAREVLGRRPYVGTPMRAKGEILGVLSVIGEPERQFTAEEVALLASIADQIGVAVENARLYEQAEQLAVMEERQRLARELHDSVTQSLYSANLMAETGRRAARAGLLPAVEGYLERLGQIARDALKEMRLLVYELRPSVLESEGLIVALQQRLDAVEGRAGIEARLLVDGDIDLPGSVEVALYRIAQEALNNALKHSDASMVTIRIRANVGGLELEISDDGCGFEPSSAAAGGMGLTTMRERAEQLGGQLIIISKPGDGTTVKVRLVPSAIA